LTPEQLRKSGRGVRVPLVTVERKYRGKGFATPSGRLEIFSPALQAIGQPPLPEFRASAQVVRDASEGERFPYILTSTKSPLYCHSQHRNLPSLRRRLPEPTVELSPNTAASRGIKADDWVAIITPQGQVRARARVMANLADGVVAAQHGWWQACPELDLPGYDPLGPDGANVNLVIGSEIVDPVSGAASLRASPCNIERLA
jgi:anaerobic selenocysteine-containing dehydrogenase